MADGEREIIVNKKDINSIKKIIFEKYPELKPYSNSCVLGREFGEIETCGVNTITFKISPSKEIEFLIIYCENTG